MGGRGREGKEELRDGYRDKRERKGVDKTEPCTRINNVECSVRRREKEKRKLNGMEIREVKWGTSMRIQTKYRAKENKKINFTLKKRNKKNKRILRDWTCEVGGGCKYYGGNLACHLSFQR